MPDTSNTTDWTAPEEEAAAAIREITPCTRLMSLHAARAALSVERERCAKIVDRHPDEAHPASFDAEDVRGCCEVMAARIRSGEP